MTYSLSTQCYGCMHKATCKDQENVQKGINKCYEDYSTHKGSGTVILWCNQYQKDPTIR